MIKTYFNKMKGYEKSLPRKPFSKILWSGIGSFIGIYLVSIIPQLMHIDILNSLLLVGSFGASSVLIYGAPQADFSQPKNLIGGHIISAIIGITVYKYINLDISMLAALAVSFSIIAMQYTCTMHPPGGATALIAVIGSDTIHGLGYMYVISPIAIGALLLLLIALVVNNISNNPKRNYPRSWF
jgi:CBS-domain-containing membrane protein